jgi:hypothetical protein
MRYRDLPDIAKAVSCIAIDTYTGDRDFLLSSMYDMFVKGSSIPIDLFVWSQARGLRICVENDLGGVSLEYPEEVWAESFPRLKDPISIVQTIENWNSSETGRIGYFILERIDFWMNPAVIDTFLTLKETRGRIFLTGDKIQLPERVRNVVPCVSFPSPPVDECEEILNRAYSSLNIAYQEYLPEIRRKIPNAPDSMPYQIDDIDEVLKACVGVPRFLLERSIKLSATHLGRFDQTDLEH